MTAPSQVALGMASIMLLFMGQFALFTYLAIYANVTRVSIPTLSLNLLLMRLAGIAGTYLISSSLARGSSAYWPLYLSSWL